MKFQKVCERPQNCKSCGLESNTKLVILPQKVPNQILWEIMFSRFQIQTLVTFEQYIKKGEDRTGEKEI